MTETKVSAYNDTGEGVLLPLALMHASGDQGQPSSERVGSVLIWL
jgi:hypothetical protein